MRTVNRMTFTWNCPELQELFTAALEAADKPTSDTSVEATQWVTFRRVEVSSGD